MFTFIIDNLESDEDREKMRLIYEEYYGVMMGTAINILADRSLAEDAVSEGIITIIKNLHKISDVLCYRTKAYIVIIIRSRAINIFNKQKKVQGEPINDFELHDNNISVLDSITTQETYETIVKSIRTLSKSLSDVLYLSVILEHSANEISELLNISNDAVRQRLSRAKAQVKKKLLQEASKYDE